MIERAARAGIPGNVILADSAYGDSCEFRETVRMLGFDYAVGVHKSTGCRPHRDVLLRRFFSGRGVRSTTLAST